VKLFKLSPIDAADSDWQCSRFCGDVLVRAKNENKARALAMREFGLLDPIGEGSCICPWTSESHTRCKLVGESEGSDKEGLLLPVS
jgi:hypothetical protein